MAKSPEQALHKHIRILPEHWERIESAAEGSNLTANQLLVELAMDALDRREWPGENDRFRPVVDAIVANPG